MIKLFLLSIVIQDMNKDLSILYEQGSSNIYNLMIKRSPNDKSHMAFRGFPNIGRELGRVHYLAGFRVLHR